MSKQILVQQSSHHTLCILYPGLPVSKHSSPTPEGMFATTWKWTENQAEEKCSWGNTASHSDGILFQNSDCWVKESTLLTENIWFTVRLFCDPGEKNSYSTLHVTVCQAQYQELYVCFLISFSHQVHELLLPSIWNWPQRSNLPKMMKQPRCGPKSLRRGQWLVLSEADKTRMSCTVWLFRGQRAVIQATPLSLPNSLSVLVGQVLRWFPALSLSVYL